MIHIIGFFGILLLVYFFILPTLIYGIAKKVFPVYDLIVPALAVASHTYFSSAVESDNKLMMTIVFVIIIFCFINFKYYVLTDSDIKNKKRFNLVFSCVIILVPPVLFLFFK